MNNGNSSEPSNKGCLSHIMNKNNTENTHISNDGLQQLQNTFYESNAKVLADRYLPKSWRDQFIHAGTLPQVYSTIGNIHKKLHNKGKTSLYETRQYHTGEAPRNYLEKYEGAYKCLYEQCDYVSKKKNNTQACKDAFEHVMNTHFNKQYVCNVCEKYSSTRERDVIPHINRYHLCAFTHTCKPCGKNFYSRKLFMGHIKRVHSEKR